MNSRNKTLWIYLLPVLIGNCSYIIQKITNGIFIGNGINADALGAMNIAYPYTLAVYAIFTLLSIGGVTIAGIRIGRGDIIGANQVFMHACGGIFLLAAVLTAVGLVFANQIAIVLGSNATYQAMVVEYLRVYSLFLIPSGLWTALSFFCSIDGDPGRSGAASVVYTISCVFFDWVFLIILRLGIVGAAFSLGVATLISDVILLSHFFPQKGALRFAPFQLQLSLYRKIAARGMPEMISQFAIPVLTILMNRMLITQLGDSAVNAFSIISYVTSMFTFLFSGMVNGMQPLFGRSFGAGAKDDLRYYFHRGLCISLLLNTAVYVIIVLLAPLICEMFRADAATTKVVLSALPKYSLYALFGCLNVMLASYLYSTKRTRDALIINICRSFLFCSFSVCLMPVVLGSWAIWYAVPATEALTLAVALGLMAKNKKQESAVG